MAVAVSRQIPAAVFLFRRGPVRSSNSAFRVNTSQDNSVSVQSTRVRPGQLTEPTRVNSVGSRFGSTVQVWVQILALRCSVQTGHSQRFGSANQSTHITRSTFSQHSRHPVNSRPGMS
ncbi:hypothetical protein HanPSC8_Chr03g0116611 [Helianthus annuus]|nr:hypothetical protein HanPSC8_Chr03g0116611 [Helianthus annuus]